MFCGIEKYEDWNGNFWKLIDSDKGEYNTGWLTTRPVPFVIIRVYSDWNMDPLPNLKAYYLNEASSLNEAMHLLDKDFKIMTEKYYTNRVFNATTKSLPCIKNYLKKMSYVGLLPY